MKYISLLALVFPFISFAEVITECGEYTARGIIRFDKKKVEAQLYVNEKTQSQYVVSFTDLERIKLVGYTNRDVVMKLSLNRMFNGTQILADKILSNDYRVPNPINPADTGFILDKKIPCLKE